MIECEREIISIRGMIHSAGNTGFPRLECRDSSVQHLDILTRKLAQQREEKKRKKPRILCSQCWYLITHNEYAISVAGLFKHVFVNPAGVPYQIGCFSSAPGCCFVGEPTLAFTWFPGYTWSYAMCDKCFTHLGWYYQSGEFHFYGLILNRLIDAAEKE